TTKKFKIINVSSKFGICGMPLRADTYKSCSFGCKYCFSNNRKVMGNNCGFAVGDIKHLERLFKKVFDDQKVDNTNFLEVLLSQHYPLHCGGMSDPFQPCEEKYGITAQLVDLSNKYRVPIVFSTKSDTVYGAKINPDLHTFQLSVSNMKNYNNLEPNVPSFEKRARFYDELKAKGFKVGIRIQPFIPGVTEPEIIDRFKDADNITIESIKLVPQNPERREELRKMIGLKKEDFYYFGLANIKPEIKLEYYQPILDKIFQYRLPFSVADNDLRWIGTNKCCCGDRLVPKFTSFNITTMMKTHKGVYDLADVIDAAEEDGVLPCKCKPLFASNRQPGVDTVEDFLRHNFNNKKSPMCPDLQHYISSKNTTKN
ncbi:MAG: hypothetical protein J5826_06545, partial [Bacteroidales bacterium]|nr:hypothetical protein [Bacteroidales bacterium]